MNYPINKITKGAITRLARKAGVKSLSGLVYEEVRFILRMFLEKFIKNTIVFKEQRRAKRVSGEDVRNAVRMMGKDAVETDIRKVVRRAQEYMGIPKRTENELLGKPFKACGAKPRGGPRKKSPGRKPMRFKKGTQAIREIRFYQNQRSACFAIPKLSFDTVVRKIAKDYLNDIQFSGEALGILQLVTENHIIKLFQNANKLALHSARVRVNNKDIETAQMLFN